MRFVSIIAVLLTTGCSAGHEEAVGGQDAAAEADARKPTTKLSAPPSQEPPENWIYDNIVDEMRGTTTRRAIAVSENSVELEAPYGSTGAALIVRNQPPEGLDILLMADDGQILCQSYRGQKISVKFDSGPIEAYSCVGTSDGSSNAIFLRPKTRFLKRLKVSKSVLVEAEFYRAGNQQFKFSVSGLKGTY